MTVPETIAASSASRTTRAVLLATVKGNQTVAFFDEGTGERIAAPVVGTPDAKPHEIALSADGSRAFVSLYGTAGYPDNVPANKVAVVDVRAMALETTIDLDLYTGPHGLARDATGRIWATAENNRCLIAIDPETLGVTRAIYTEAPAHFLFPSRDRRTLYSAHKEVPFIGVHDAPMGRMVDRIPLDLGSQALWHAPDCARLYVGDFNRPLFHVVDTVSRRVTHSVPLKGVPGWPYATPDGKHIVVSTYIEAEDRGFAEIFDAATFAPISRVGLPAEPFHVLDGDDGGQSVLIVVGDGRLVRMAIATGTLANVQYDTGAPMPEQVVRVHLPIAD
ncbi:MAG: hypothetical protein AAF318_01630 [Pseudomonadota bacterium]